MDAVRIETTVDEQGEVHLSKLPFPAGERVEVTVALAPHGRLATDFHLRGLSVRYDRPTDAASCVDRDELSVISGVFAVAFGRSRRSFGA